MALQSARRRKQAVSHRFQVLRSPPEGKDAVRREVEVRLAKLGILAKIQFGDFELPEPDLLTNREIARFLRVSLDTLREWRKAGGGPPFLWLSGNNHRRHLRYLRRSLGRWLNRRIEGAAKETERV